jgi:hypothetical protein
MTIQAKKGKFPLIGLIGFPLFGLLLLPIFDIARNYSDTVYVGVMYMIPFVVSAYWVLVLSLAGLVDFTRAWVNKQATLTITDSGIDDKLSIYSAGNVLWTEITGIKIVTGVRNDFLIIEVTNPEKFISKKFSPLRLPVKSIFKKYGSPVFISQKKVDCDLNELKELLLEGKNK